MPPLRAPTVFVLSLALVACSAGATDAIASGALVAERTTAGDTSVVRTVSGSTWGTVATLEPEVQIGVLEGDEHEMFGSVWAIAADTAGRMYVLDRQANALRVFDADGRFVNTWGRKGAGPGEFRSPDGGLAVLSDGRVVVRDPGNARLQLFSRDGEPLETWSVIAGNWRSRDPFYRSGDTLLTPLPYGEIKDITDVTMALYVIAPSGQLTDTLPLPSTGLPPSPLRARNGGNNASMQVPWLPQDVWTWHPDGYFASGHSSRYAITLARRDGPLRIERDVTLPVVGDGEREQERSRVTNGLRWLDSSWTWNGPQIPDTKPAFRAIFAGRDGRLWVWRSAAAYPLEAPYTDENGTNVQYGEDRQFDVFEPDGTFLGEVRVPREFTVQPAPLFDGERVWAVTRDSLDVQRLVRYRLARLAPAGH